MSATSLSLFNNTLSLLLHLLTAYYPYYYHHHHYSPRVVGGKKINKTKTRSKSNAGSFCFSYPFLFFSTWLLVLDQCTVKFTPTIHKHIEFYLSLALRSETSAARAFNWEANASVTAPPLAFFSKPFSLGYADPP